MKKLLVKRYGYVLVWKATPVGDGTTNVFKTNPLLLTFNFRRGRVCELCFESCYWSVSACFWLPAPPSLLAVYGFGGEAPDLSREAAAVRGTLVALLERLLPRLEALVAVIVVLFIIWAAVTDLKEVARAPGEIIPSGDIKVVQHLDGGAISEILVEEGQLVEKGQVLLRVSGSKATAELSQMAARLDGLRLREERLLAVTEGKLDFGPWERIFYGEFDGRRAKRVLVKVIGG